MKITDGIYVQIKPSTTKSIDVHIEADEYVNIVLPSGRILTVDYIDATLWDDDESLLDEFVLNGKRHG